MAEIYDVLILGAGAAGLMCAAVAGQCGRRVRVLERAERIGKKILISGGGRCNFTNLYAGAENYLSGQPAFCRSALARYQPTDFVELIQRHGIAYHEKKLGQLFCDGSSREIVAMLAAECRDAGVRIDTNTDVRDATRCEDGGFRVRVDGCDHHAQSLVVATGGLSLPKLGGSDLAYRLAQGFGLRLVAPRPGLVPLTFHGETGRLCERLSGVSMPCAVGTDGGPSFHENLLFTHRGLSGPAVLQISSYLNAHAQDVYFDLLPDQVNREKPWLVREHEAGNPAHLANVLSERLPARAAEALCRPLDGSRPLREHPRKALATLEQMLRRWKLHPDGTEGFTKAEVTLGGVDTRDLSGKTMEARGVPGLYFIGEAVDVTGHLGGFNFQWAWASGHAAAMALSSPA